MRCSTRISLAILLTAAALPATAAPIVAGTTQLRGRAIQDITLLPGTPFNRSSRAFVIDDLFGDGVITLNRNVQVGDLITFSSLSGGQFYGSNPILGDYVFGNVPPLTGANFSGTIAGVVQNSGSASGLPSSFQSGNFSFGGDSFGFALLNGSGITLFTDPNVPFRFSATFDGLPPTPGTVLVNSGPDVLNVYFGDELVATSSNRRIVLTAVPEPATMTLLAAGTIGLFGYRLRNRKMAFPVA